MAPQPTGLFPDGVEVSRFSTYKCVVSEEPKLQ